MANLFFRKERRGKDNRSNDVYTNPKERGFFGGALPRLAIYIYIYTYTKDRLNARAKRENRVDRATIHRDSVYIFLRAGRF